MQAEAEEITAEGRKGYLIPGGGSNALGAMGYVACAEEIMQQGFEMGLAFDRIVCSSGSGGTHAGLVTGTVGVNANVPVTGISVRARREPQEAKLHALAQEVADKLAIRGGVPHEAFTVYDDYVGPGYSLPTEGMVEAVRLFARLEGILLDPVYTGKTAAGMIDLVRRGHFKKGEPGAVSAYRRLPGALRLCRCSPWPGLVMDFEQLVTRPLQRATLCFFATRTGGFARTKKAGFWQRQVYRHRRKA